MSDICEEDPEFAKDLLRGARAIAVFLYGCDDVQHRRKVYHLKESKLPTFKLGSIVCARKSVLMKWVIDQEQRHAA